MIESPIVGKGWDFQVPARPNLLPNMRNKVNLFLIATFLLAMRFPLEAFASNDASGSSATLAISTVSAQQVVDYRGQALKSYLEIKNSPLADEADYIIQEADKYKLDWKLIPSIAGLESGYCLEIPVSSYNCYGYGIYGDNVRYFNSWDDGIATVSAALRNDYIDKGAITVDQIGRIYAASPTWAVRVEANMKDLQDYSTKFQTESLPISL